MVNNVEEATILRILQKVEDLENGSEDLNRKTDFLGADNLPPVTETGELADL